MTEVSNMETLMAHEWGGSFSVKPAISKQTPSSSQEYSGFLNRTVESPSTLNFLMQLYHACEGKFTKEVRKQVVGTFCSKVIEVCSTTEASMKGSVLKLGEFTCPMCFGNVREPVTMICGHTYCRKCLSKEVQGMQCKICPVKFTPAQIGNTRPNVVLMDLANKCLPSAGALASLRNEGNELFSANKHKEAVQKYAKAIELCKLEALFNVIVS